MTASTAASPRNAPVARSSVSRTLVTPLWVRITLDTVPFTANRAEAVVTIAYPSRGCGRPAGRAPWRTISVTAAG